MKTSQICVAMACLLSIYESACLAGEPSATYAQFKRSIQAAIARGEVDIYPPNFRWTSTELQRSRSDPQAFDINETEKSRWICTRHQLDVEAIRRFQATNEQQRTFWKAVLPEMEKKIAALYEFSIVGGTDAELDEKESAIYEVYGRALNDLARRYGRNDFREVVVMAQRSANVSLPDGGTAKYMSGGKYLMCTAYAGGKEPDWAHPAWLDVSNGQHLAVADVSRFLVRWPDGYERRLRITYSGVITLRRDIDRRSKE